MMLMMMTATIVLILMTIPSVGWSASIKLNMNRDSNQQKYYFSLSLVFSPSDLCNCQLSVVYDKTDFILPGRKHLTFHMGITHIFVVYMICQSGLYFFPSPYVCKKA